jgi:hypothetical protein
VGGGVLVYGLMLGLQHPIGTTNTGSVLPMGAESEQKSVDQGICPTKSYDNIVMSSRMDKTMIP